MNKLEFRSLKVIFFTCLWQIRYTSLLPSPSRLDCVFRIRNTPIILCKIGLKILNSVLDPSPKIFQKVSRRVDVTLAPPTHSPPGCVFWLGNGLMIYL